MVDSLTEQIQVVGLDVFSPVPVLTVVVELDPNYYQDQGTHYPSEYDQHMDASAGYYLPPQHTFTRQPASFLYFFPYSPLLTSIP